MLGVTAMGCGRSTVLLRASSARVLGPCPGRAAALCVGSTPLGWGLCPRHAGPGWGHPQVPQTNLLARAGCRTRAAVSLAPVSFWAGPRAWSHLGLQDISGTGRLGHPRDQLCQSAGKGHSQALYLQPNDFPSVFWAAGGLLHLLNITLTGAGSRPLTDSRSAGRKCWSAG